MSVNPIPDGYRTVTPYLVLENAADVLEFAKQAFGAEEKRLRMEQPNGSIGHAELVDRRLGRDGRQRRSGKPGDAGDDPSLRRRLRRDV